MMVFAVIIAVVGTMKFWNGIQILDAKTSAEQIANDMTFMQYSKNAVRVYDIPATVRLRLDTTYVTAEPTVCAPGIDCAPAVVAHHVAPSLVLGAVIEPADSGAEAVVTSIAKSTRKVCLSKRENTRLTLCAYGESCCVI